MEIKNTKEKYKKAYEILMQYFDSIPDEEKEFVDQELNKLGV